MATPRVLELRSPRELRAVGEAWDDLLGRSAASLPTFRAECLAQWLAHFEPRAVPRILAVERAGRLIAALPLVGGTTGRLVPTGRLPMNEWSPCGELLLDETEPAEESLAPLLAALTKLPWPLLSLGWVPFEAPRWRAFRQAAERAGLDVETRPEFEVGWLPLGEGMEKRAAGRSKNHRRNMVRGRRKLEALGPLRLEVLEALRPEEVEGPLRLGFEIEHRSWKGAAGSSVLSEPGLFSFYLEQAMELARHGELLLAFLHVGERPAAFEYGWRRAGVYYSYKVGYDPAFAAGSPGQLLMGELIGHGEAAGWRGMHCMGPLTPAVAAWGVERLAFGRLAIPLSWPGRAIRLAAGVYSHVRGVCIAPAVSPTAE